MLEQKHMARDTRDPMRQVAWKLLRVSLSHFWRAPELVLFAFYLSSGTDSQTPKGHGQTPRAQSRTNSLWHRHARARARVHTNACPPAKHVYIPGSGLLALKGLIRFVLSLFWFSRVTSSFDFRRQQRPCWCPKPETPHSKPWTPHPDSDGSNGPVGARHATAAAEYAGQDSHLTNAACVTGTHLR